jgi:uncharacterized SAM-binding protein YcdF (DUF218 family)
LAGLVCLRAIRCERARADYRACKKLSPFYAWARLRTILKLFFRAAIGLVLLMMPVAVVVYFYPEKILCVDSGPVSADVIVILGGGLHERPERAAELFQQHAAPRIIISGAGDDWINRLILRQKGVPASAIEVEGDSTTTRENAEFTLKRLRAENVRRVILVTSWYHARRALKTFEHYAPEIKFYSRPSYFAFAREDWPQRGNGKRMRLEFLKLPGYWLRYGVNPF